jgi:OFA family oxalate/formate antiporter-like MFS transporter
MNGSTTVVKQAVRARQEPRGAANRWVVAAAGAVLQLCLGTVYAWSFFQKAIVAGFGWSNSATAWAFSAAICVLGVAAAAGGIKLAAIGPRRLAVCGIALYAAGHIIGGVALATGNIALFYAGYGLVGGVGLGLGYVTPVATVARWFPDRKGLLTGLVVMGFGLGALLMSKVIAPLLLDAFMPAQPAGGTLAAAYRIALPWVFAGAGVVLALLGVPAALVLRNPPAGYSPSGAAAQASGSRAPSNDHGLSPAACVLSGRFALLWIVLFCNVTAGIMFIGFQSPLLQDLLQAANPAMTATALAAAGATLIAVSALFNGVGRLFWGGLSDRIGRANALRSILGSQILVFTLLLSVSNPWLFGVLVCYVLLCYGGGFGSAPSIVIDVFGQRVMPVVYGSLLTAWSMGGVVGPQLVASFTDHDPQTAATNAFLAGIVVLGVGLAAALLLSDRPLAARSARAGRPAFERGARGTAPGYGLRWTIARPGLVLMLITVAAVATLTTVLATHVA